MSSEEHESELNPLPSESESTLSERVAQLEQKLDDLLMLLSDVYRYGKLRDLLAEGKWKEADQQTTKIMLEIAGKGSQDVFTPEAVKTFPCNTIRVIDQLWRKYSNDRFGFSVQLRIYQSLGGNMDTLIAQNMKFLHSLGERIGWRKNKKWIEYDHFDFSVPPPVGAFPGEWWHSPYGEKMANFFFAHLIRCEL